MIAALKITGVATLIFAAGALTGGLASARLGLVPGRSQAWPPSQVPPASALPSEPREFRAAPPAPPEPRRKDRTSGGPRLPGNQRLEVLRHLEDALPLDPSQRDRIRALVQESDQRIRREWEPVYPRIQGELRDLRRRISAELRPDQRVRLDLLLDRKGHRRTNDVPPTVR